MRRSLRRARTRGRRNAGDVAWSDALECRWVEDQLLDGAIKLADRLVSRSTLTDGAWTVEEHIDERALGFTWSVVGCAVRTDRAQMAPDSQPSAQAEVSGAGTMSAQAAKQGSHHCPSAEQIS